MPKGGEGSREWSRGFGKAGQVGESLVTLSYPINRFLRD